MATVFIWVQKSSAKAAPVNLPVISAHFGVGQGPETRVACLYPAQTVTKFPFPDEIFR
jgi:hypothetical protein